MTWTGELGLHNAQQVDVKMLINMNLYPDIARRPVSLGARGFKMIACLAVLLTAIGGVQGALAAERPPTKVVVDHVRQIEVSQTFPVIGRFVARQFGVVASLVGGPVKEVLVDVGDRITKDQIVARLVNDRIRANRDLMAAELRETSAALKTAEAQLKLTMGEMARLDGLRKSAAFSQARYNDKRNEVAKVRSEVTEAEGSVARARANLKLASIDLHNAEIRAPYDAVVVRRHAVAGAHLAVGDSVVTLVNDRDMEIEAEVPSNRLAGAVTGRIVDVTLDTGKKISATVRAIVPSENAQTRTRPVRLSFDGASTGLSGAIAANQSVTVLLPIAGADRVLTVHKDAVTTRGNGKFVVVINENKAKPTKVELGDAVGDRFTVTSGLKQGDIVVVRGNETLRPGQKVTFDEPSG